MRQVTLIMTTVFSVRSHTGRNNHNDLNKSGCCRSKGLDRLPFSIRVKNCDHFVTRIDNFVASSPETGDEEKKCKASGTVPHIVRLAATWQVAA